MQLTAKRTELLVHVLPDAVRNNRLMLGLRAEELYVEQQKRYKGYLVCFRLAWQAIGPDWELSKQLQHRRISKLLSIMPLSLAGFRRGASPRTPGACVTVMGLRLPGDLKPTVDNQQQAQVSS